MGQKVFLNRTCSVFKIHQPFLDLWTHFQRTITAKNWLTNVNVSFILVTFCARTNFRTACCLIHMAMRYIYIWPVSNKQFHHSCSANPSFIICRCDVKIQNNVSYGKKFDLQQQGKCRARGWYTPPEVHVIGNLVFFNVYNLTLTRWVSSFLTLWFLSLFM